MRELPSGRVNYLLRAFEGQRPRRHVIRVSGRRRRRGWRLRRARRGTSKRFLAFKRPQTRRSRIHDPKRVLIQDVTGAGEREGARDNVFEHRCAVQFERDLLSVQLPLPGRRNRDNARTDGVEFPSDRILRLAADVPLKIAARPGSGKLEGCRRGPRTRQQPGAAAWNGCWRCARAAGWREHTVAGLEPARGRTEGGDSK